MNCNFFVIKINETLRIVNDTNLTIGTVKSK